MNNQLIENRIAELTFEINEAHNYTATLNHLSKFEHADRKLDKVLAIKRILENINELLDDLERLLMEEHAKEER